MVVNKFSVLSSFVLSIFFLAGIQTSAETLYWAIALLTEYPDIQAKVHKEIDDVVGRDRIPTIGDRGTLSYTEATLYEVMRYSTIAPLLLPHGTMKDVEFRKWHC